MKKSKLLKILMSLVVGLGLSISTAFSDSIIIIGEDDPGIIITPAPANLAPAVNAGSDQTITLPDSTALDATVTDDGLPNPPGAVIVTWSKVSGPGTVTFADTSANDTSVSFAEDGIYVLELSASDGELQSSDQVIIAVLPQNQAPVVAACDDQTITLPDSAALYAGVSDDGLPNPPGAVTLSWSKVSGPGIVTFASSSEANIFAGFSEPGIYDLKISASDGELSAYDIVTITVEPEPVIEPIMSIDINPNTLNLKSNGNFITVFIEPAIGFEADKIDVKSVKISEIDETVIDAVYACSKPSSIGDNNSNGISDLMVKFSADEVKELLSPAEKVKITISGYMLTGEEFSGSDTIRVIKPGNGNISEQIEPEDANETGSEESNEDVKEKLKEIKQKIEEAKEQAKAKKDEQKEKIEKKIEQKKEEIKGKIEEVKQGIEEKTDERNKGAEKENGQKGKRKKHSMFVSAITEIERQFCFRLGKYISQDSVINSALLSLNKELIANYEGDVTQKVKADWDNGITDIVLTLSYNPERYEDYPRLEITYNPPLKVQEDKIETETENIITVSPRVVFPEDKEVVKIFYSEEDIKGVKEEELEIYGWNEETSDWESTESVIDISENSVSTRETRYSQYRIMAKVPSAIPDEPEKTVLHQNYPNPFNPSTTIKYSIYNDCHVTLKLYSVSGRLVATLVDKYQTAGEHSIVFDGGERLSRGIYYYQLKAGNSVSTKRMVVLR